MSDRQTALAAAITAVADARGARDDEPTDELDHALLLLHVLQALDESDGETREILREALRYVD